MILIPDWVKKLTQGHPVLAVPERRGAPRIPLRLPTEYIRPGGIKARLCFTINICESGVLLCLPEKLNGGDLLRVEIYYYFNSSLMRVKVLGKVVWIRKKKDSAKYHCAVKFIEIAPADARNLRQFLKKFVIEDFYRP
jgi:c-di-GMP-binding flagellar brake protein YcgR